jgi:RNA polymerase sigma-70 factor (ECF subfamily)
MVSGQSNGDWRGLWREYGPRLLLFARQQVRELPDAEDVVQEAFVRYWRSHAKDPTLTPDLLFTLVRRVAIDQARQQTSRRAREQGISPGPEDQPTMFADPLVERERREMIESSMCALPATQREVLVLKIWGDLTFDEIGQVLEISPNTAASRYRYALQQLKGAFAPSSL